MRKILSVFCLAVLVAISPATYASWQAASEPVDKTSAELIHILGDSSLVSDTNTTPLLAEVERLLVPVVDFEYIAKRVMGKYYRKATAEERTEFTGVFKNTLIRTYAKALVGFEITGYELLPEGRPSPKPNKQIVSVKVRSGGSATYKLDYYMLQQSNGWKLVNVHLDGINLRLNFKNQFASLVKKNRGDVAKVIANWKAQVQTDVSK